MNRPCSKCGRIVTIPDIPLPAGYTQKCTACGFANMVADDLDQLRPGGKPLDPEESWEASFDSTMDIGESSTEQSSQPLEDRFRELEARLRADLERSFDLVKGHGSSEKTKAPTSMLTHPLVATHEVMIGTQNTAIYHKCFSVLSEAGYRVEGAGELNKAYELVRRQFFQILVLDQQFLNSGEAGRLIFQHIRETPTDIRRAQTIVLLTPGIATNEPQVFYQWGIDLNIHPRDLDSMSLFVRRHLSYKDKILEPLTRES